ncbi:hypothetical protein DFH09DRAFT_1453900 [Mycena vulgaris]|nr:hypothetical protein DFH09DRAFT_1453900 [Mycena vulgaris]
MTRDASTIIKKTNSPEPIEAVTAVGTHNAAPLLAQGVIRLNTEVRDVAELPACAGWRVRMRCWGGAVPEELEEVWDAVVIAVACYDHPVFPAAPCIAQLRELQLAHHAQSWRRPPFVIANANSDNDIAAQLPWRRRGLPKHPPAQLPRLPEPAGRAGSTLRGLDAVLFGTGYHPFSEVICVLPLHHTPNDCVPHADALEPLVTPTTAPARIPHLHRYTLCAPNPALALVSTTFASYTPFAVAEVLGLPRGS